jgi:hypothetical protein
MFDLISDFFSGITWRSVLIGALIFVGSFLVNLAIVSFILIKLPADHFSKSNKERFAWSSNPMEHSRSRVGGFGSCAFVAGGSRSGVVNNSAGDHVARLSGQAPSGTEVVK